MTAITFDTLAYTKTLREAGFTEQQAEAQANALSDVLKSGAGELATKQDMASMEERIGGRLNLLEERVDGKFKLLQWMLGFDLAITVAILFVLMKGH